MCIVVIKEKGMQFPTVEQIQNCVENNPDGFGMAWNENGQLCTYRTMKSEDFLSKYKEVSSRTREADTAMIIHARIATHGSCGVNNCHCWTGGGFAFAHNGILSVANRGDMTDSETFFRDIFLPVYRSGGWKAGKKVVKAIIGSSKFAFMDKTGRIWKFGNYESDWRGNFFSNGTYKYGYSKYWGGKQVTNFDWEAWREKYCGYDYGYGEY